MLERLSARTVLHVHRILHKALADAVKWGLLIRNPCDAVTPPRVERKEISVWDPTTINAFLEESETSPFRDAYILLLHTGLRFGELVNMEWADVNMAERELKVCPKDDWVPKTSSSSRVVTTL